MAKYSCAVCDRTRKQTKDKVGAWARDPSYDGVNGSLFLWCCGICEEAAKETAYSARPPDDPEIARGPNDVIVLTSVREARDKTLTEMIRLARIRHAEDLQKEGQPL